MRISRNFKIFLFFFVPVLIWMEMIFYFSSIPGLKAGLSTGKELVFRKFAHLFEFGVLVWLIFRWLYKGEELSLKKSLASALVLSLGFAISDEIHQVFVYGRQGKPEDVVIDFLGISFSLCLIFIFSNRKKQKNFLVGGLMTIVFMTSFAFLLHRMIKEAEEIKKNGLRQQNFQIPFNKKDKVKAIFENKSNNEKELKPEKNNWIKISQDEKEQEADNDFSLINEQEKHFNQVISKGNQEEILFDVPFTSQAPFGIWDDIHEEACEEASLIMVKFYLDKKQLNPKIAEEEIQKLIEFQLKEYGDYKDSNMERLLQIGKKYYEMENLRVVYNFSKEDLKRNLQEGKIMIAPTAGRRLGNPFFTPPGPLYHNLVLKGFKHNEIITNDPGTKRGNSFGYNIDVLYDAIFDFPGKKEDIEKGKKAILVVDVTLEQ